LSCAVVAVVSADVSVRSLVNVKSQCIGEAGHRGQSKHCHGANADDTVVHVCPANYCFITCRALVRKFQKSWNLKLISSCPEVVRFATEVLKPWRIKKAVIYVNPAELSANTLKHR